MDFLKQQWSSSSSNSSDVEEARGYFASVAEIFPKGQSTHSSLPWGLAVSSTRSCFGVMRLPDGETMAKEFVDDYLFKIVHLLLQQHPSKLGTNERDSIERTVKHALHIFLKLSPEQMHRNANVLSDIFGRQADLYFYTGNKVNWSHSEGFPRFRSEMIKEFAKAKGFQRLLGAVLNEASWHGSMQMMNFLEAAREAYKENYIDVGMLVNVLHEVSASLLRAKDDDVKNDDSGSVSDLIKRVQYGYRTAQQPMEDYYKFWLQHTLKLMGSEPLVLRLFAWEQIAAIIETAEWHKPVAMRYIVEGAGCEAVNGTYEFLRKQEDKDKHWSIIYQKKGNDDLSPPMPTLTLIRCKMKDDCKKWFFSEVEDINNPGTNSDIDYYNQGKAVPSHQKYLEREPPSQPYSWEVSKNKKKLDYAPAPPGPTLRKEGEYLPAGESVEMPLIKLIPEWFRTGKVLKSVFADGNISREVVSRSKQLLQYVASSEALTADDLLVMWTAALQEQDVIIAESVFDLLAELSPKLTPELFESLMSTAKQRVQSGSEADFEKVVLFVEKYCRSGFQLVDTLRDGSVKSLIALVWTLYQDPRFESVKGRQSIETLLSTCLGSPGGASVTLDQVQECVDSLVAAKTNTGNGSALSSNGGSGGDVEMACSRVVHTLQFLISKHTKPATIIKLGEKEALPRAVVEEVRRFVEKNRGTASMRRVETSTGSGSSSGGGKGSRGAGEEVSAYVLGIRDRLQVLVQFYSHASEVKMSLSDAKALYTLLAKDKEELAELHRMLLRGVATSAGDAIFTLSVARSVFLEYFCAAAMQWALCDANALECFQSFYTRLLEQEQENHPAEEDIQFSPETESGAEGDDSPASAVTSPSAAPRQELIRSGVAALWRLALALPAEGSTPARAMELLLKVYEPEPEPEQDSSHGMGPVISGPICPPAPPVPAGFENQDPTSVTSSLEGLSLGQSAALSSSGGGPRGTVSGETVEGLFEAAFAHLQNALMEARAQNGALKASSELVVLRVLSLLSMAITRSQGGFVNAGAPMHATKGIMQNIRVKVKARKVITYRNHSTNTSVSRLEKGSETALTINTHPMHSLKSLRAAIAAAGRYAAASKLSFDDDHLQDAADSTLVGELGVKEGSEVSVYYSSAPTYPTAYSGQANYGRGNNAFPFSGNDDLDTPDDTGDEAPLVHDVAGALSDNDARFSCLLDLCDNVDSEQVLQRLWWVIGMIPTQGQMSTAFRGMLSAAAAGTAQPEQGWKQFLYSGGAGNTGAAESGARALYTLQTLDHLLQPSPELLKVDEAGTGFTANGDGAGAGVGDAEAMKQMFEASGGFTSLVDVVLSAGAPADKAVDEETFIRRSTQCTALHIMHFLLLGALDVDVDVMTLEHSAVLRSPTDAVKSDDLDDVDLRTYAEAMEGSIGAQEGASRVSTGASAASTGAGAVTADPRFMSQLELGSSAMASKLISLAISATGTTTSTNVDTESAAGISSASGGPDFVQLKTCLDLLTLLLRFEGASSGVMANETAKKLMVTSLRSHSELTRRLCSRFAICVGQSQSNVFKWLVAEIDGLKAGDSTCGELFEAIGALLADGSNTSSEPDDVASLAQFVASKLSGLRGSTNASSVELLGFLKLLEVLVKYHPQALARATPDGTGLEQLLIDEFLFTVSPSMLGGRASGPSDASRPLCDTPILRAKAFNVLLAFAGASSGASGGESGETSGDPAIKRVAALLESASAMRGTGTGWALLASDFNSLQGSGSEVAFSGLKNQGCTCYANSLLQQLFMCKGFRAAVMQTPIQEHHRNTFWHLSNADLVGRTLAVENNSKWTRYRVKEYDEATSTHSIEGPCDDQGTPLETANTFKFPSMQKYREEHRVRLCAADGVEDKPLTKDDQAALAIFDQLQRTFAYLESSKRTYYDPRPLIEACKPLNMQFSVFHQNDACEFFDKLMEKLETAMGGKHSGLDVWKEVVQRNVFGGSQVYEKIPKNCEKYSRTKADCEFFSDVRKEEMKNLVMVVRGRSSLKNALDSEFTGELMQGENGIKCESCDCKKDTTRRLAILELPNHFVVHLRRFDLDYTTFETMKINSRFEFPMTLDVLPWTKRGQDIAQKREEKRQAQEAGQQQQQQQQQQESSAESRDNAGDGSGEPKDEPEPDTPIPADADADAGAGAGAGGEEDEEAIDPLDTTFELAGVLAHSGVANGGHYYSFCRSPEEGEAEKWFRLDDDDVTPFDPSDIPYQCYGGPGGEGDTHDKSSNGLILFYNKVRPQYSQSAETGTEAKEAKEEEGGKRGRLVNGYEAYEPEIGQSNLLHTLHSYLLDTDLHSFLLRLSKTRARAGAGDGVGDSITFIKFLCDAVLHSRDLVVRSGARWVQAAAALMRASPTTAAWFVGSVLHDEKRCPWNKEFLGRCPDRKIKETFSTLLVSAVAAVTQALLAAQGRNGSGGADADADADMEALSTLIAEEVQKLETGAADSVDKELALKVRSTIVDAAVGRQTEGSASSSSPEEERWMRVELLALSAHKILGMLRTNVAEEGLVLVRDLCSSVPLMRSVFLQRSVIVHLAWFADPTNHTLPEPVRELYSNSAWAKYQIQQQGQQQHQHNHGQHAQQGTTAALSAASAIAFEALAAAAGAAYCARVVLLSDKVSTTSWEQQLTHSCRVAFTAIFEALLAEQRERETAKGVAVDAAVSTGVEDGEIEQTSSAGAIGSEGAPTLDYRALESYLSRIGEQFVTPQGLLDKYRLHVSAATGGLSLLGFLQYVVDRGNATNSGESTLWDDLQAYHFRNDLTRDMNEAARAAEKEAEALGLALHGDEAIVSEPVSQPSSGNVSPVPSNGGATAITGLAVTGTAIDAGDNSDSSVQATTDMAGYELATDGDSEGEGLPTLVADSAGVAGSSSIGPGRYQQSGPDFSAEIGARASAITGTGARPSFDDDFGVGTGGSEFQQISPKKLEVDELCRSVLSSPELYAHGMEAAPAATRGLIRCACFEEQHLSLQLMEDALGKLAHFTRSGSKNATTAVMTLLSSLLALDDSLVQHRSETLLMHPTNGLVAVIMSELSNPSPSRAARWDPYHSVKSSYMEYLAHFIRHSPTHSLLERLSKSDPAVRRVRRQLKSEGGDFSEEEEDLMRKCVIVVADCGYPEIDGEYSFARVFTDSGMYVKDGEYTDEEGTVQPDMRFCIYKCQVRSKANQWFVSVVPREQEPGTSKDVDFFYQTNDGGASGLLDRVLPPQNWNNYDGSRVPPLVKGGRTNTSPAPRLELQFQWEEPELQEIGDEAVTIAAQPTPTSSTYGNSDIYQGGGTYGRGYDGENTWDNDDIYGNESKAYDTGNYYSRD